MVKATSKFVPNVSAQKNIDDDILTQLKENGEELLSLIQQEAPVKTGALRDSFRVDADKKDVAVLTDSSYASEVIFGTRTKSGNNFPQRAIERLKKLK